VTSNIWSSLRPNVQRNRQDVRHEAHALGTCTDACTSLRLDQPLTASRRLRRQAMWERVLAFQALRQSWAWVWARAIALNINRNFGVPKCRMCAAGRRAWA